MGCYAGIFIEYSNVKRSYRFDEADVVDDLVSSMWRNQLAWFYQEARDGVRE